MINKSISVFLPTFNEQENIKNCITSIKKYLNKNFMDYEILIISDGSNDDTEKIVNEIIARDSHVKLFARNKKLGYGAALRSGFAHSTKELIFYTDSDNQFNIESMDLLLPLIKTYDLISGFRIKREDPLMRIFIGNVYNLIIRMLFNIQIRDIDCSFKLFKKKVFKDITLKSNTGLIDAEVLIKAKKKGFKIGQIGVPHYPRLKGTTTYEIGNRNKIFAFVRPQVIFGVLAEIKNLWSDLR
ncbi:glycosyl transferase [Candidatus Levyibacteriota bacterium]|nr:glycosyl transferase [Candidatus Levybacteria bacterium]